MPKYIIERELPGVECMQKSDRRAAASNSCKTLRELGPEIQWLYSYLSKDKTHCVYIADNEQLIRQHAEKAGIPITNIYKVEAMLDPTDAEQN